MIRDHFPTNVSVENRQDKRSSSVSSHLGFQGVTQGEWDRISPFRSAAMPLRAQRKSLHLPLMKHEKKGSYIMVKDEY